MTARGSYDDGRGDVPPAVAPTCSWCQGSGVITAPMSSVSEYRGPCLACDGFGRMLEYTGAIVAGDVPSRPVYWEDRHPRIMAAIIIGSFLGLVLIATLEALGVIHRVHP